MTLTVNVALEPEPLFGVNWTDCCPATGALMVRDNAAMLLPALLLARTVKVEVPAAVGVPLMAPVEDLSERPAGRVPLLNDHVMGPVPVALKVVK
jgi:hypothetical protein